MTKRLSIKNPVDTKKIVSELEGIVGNSYVLWRPEDLVVYEYDGSVDKHLPLAVVVPGSAEELAESVRLCIERGIPIVPRGSGTGLSGGAIAFGGSVQIVTSRLRRILDIDVENRLATVEPGVINWDLSEAVRKYELRYIPDPSSQHACTIGGNVAENAGGPHCLAYGVTTNHVLGVEVVLADGSAVWLGGDTREAFGYDLRGIFIGSEGMLGIVTKIVVRLAKLPESVHTLVAAFKSMESASQSVSDIIGTGVIPAALEMMDRVTIEAVEPTYHPGYPKDAAAVLLIEVEGLKEMVREQVSQIEQICLANGASKFDGSEEAIRRTELWAARKGAIGAFGNLRPNYYLVDGVVPRTKLREVMDKIAEIAFEMDLLIANVFHAGDGNLHPCILFDERVPGELEKVLEAGGRILEYCIDAGGALSGEHGIGVEKQAYMPLVFNEHDMRSMSRIPSAFGVTNGAFNPGKMFPLKIANNTSTGIPIHVATIGRTGTDEVV